MKYIMSSTIFLQWRRKANIWFKACAVADAVVVAVVIFYYCVYPSLLRCHHAQ